jgi:adenylate kinase family enzyme
MTIVLHLLGNNGVGKTTIQREMVLRHHPRVAAISVGQVLRNRYPPGYFDGQAAPQKTEAEALKIYQEFVWKAFEDCADLIIIDGQPRKASQVQIVDASEPRLQKDYLLLHASHEDRAHRLSARDVDPEAVRLSMARLDNDYRNQYEVMIELAKLGKNLDICDTSEMSVAQICDELERRYGL